MAINKNKVSIWSALGSGWTALCLFIAIYVTIPDAPWDYPFWTGLMTDPTCYYHELWVIVGTWLAGIALIVVTRLSMAVSRFLEIVATLNFLPDGRIIVYRRVKQRPESTEALTKSSAYGDKGGNAT